jgi:hypothetical protein
MPTNPTPCHAQILLVAGKDGLEIEMMAVNDPRNEAANFARWVCENSQMLMGVYNETNKSQVISGIRPRLLGPDGKLAQ